MKPYEYYSYPQRRKRAWWLPLALVLGLVIFGSVFRSCGGCAPEEEPTSTAAATGGIPGVAAAGYRTVLLDGTLYNVLDGSYAGEFDLQTLRLPEGQDPETFAREAVLNRADYEAFCAAWGLQPAFPDHDGGYAVIARARTGAAGAEVQPGGVSVSGQSVTVVLRDRFPAGADTAGFVLTVPVPAKVTVLKTEALYTPEEIEDLRQSGRPAGDP